MLDEIPATLRAAAYTLKSLPAACSLLWELAQSDRRAPHQHSNHPLRLLRELSELALNKPIAYNAA